MKLFVKIVLTILMLLYPVAVYFGLQYFEPKIVAVGFVGLILTRALLSKHLADAQNIQLLAVASFGGVCLAGLSFFSNTHLGLKLYPVVISFTLLGMFMLSLFKPPSMIEKFARLQEPNLSKQGVIYTRQVTKVWCLFFCLNLLISLYSAFKTSMEFWTLYNGFISYLIMGSLFIGEWCYRRFILKKEQ